MGPLPPTPTSDLRSAPQAATAKSGQTKIPGVAVLYNMTGEVEDLTEIADVRV